MSEQSKIEWTDSTFNPWLGCTKVSPACDFCYAEAWAKRSGLVQWGNSPRRRTTEAYWRNPRKWNADHDRFHAVHGRRRRVFCASLADVFDNQVPAEWRRDLWKLIFETPNLDWLLLTKRPQNIKSMLPELWGDGFDNVWIGTTVENQEQAERRVPHLLGVPAAVRFLSIEPLLGPVKLHSIVYKQEPWDDGYALMLDALTGRKSTSKFSQVDGPRVHWVIAGGESGHHARPSNPSWYRSIRGQCQEVGVPFLFKQWGNWGQDSGHPGTGRVHHFDDGETVFHYKGKSEAGRELDLLTYDGFPGGAA